LGAFPPEHLHLHPRVTCQAVGTDLARCTETRYYGIDGVGTQYGLPGQVSKVIDPNDAQTDYRYTTATGTW